MADEREKRPTSADTGAIWGTGIVRHRPGPDRRAVLGSVLVHVVLVAGLIGGSLVFAPELPQFEVYRVQLISPPPQVAGAPQPAVTPPVVRREPPRVTEPPPPTQRPQPQRPVETKPVEQPQERPEEPEPVRGRNPDPDSPGGENIEVNMEGQEFPYPDYLQNIILQLNRYFRWSGSPSLEGEVAFYIQPDGSVGAGSIRVVQKSGDFNFDLEMMSAVEQAGRRNAFGPLPDGWLQDRLWVRFKFLPPG